MPAGSLENLAGGEFLRRTSSMSSGQTHTSSKSIRSSAPVEQPLDEWEQKLYGKQGKGICYFNLYLIIQKRSLLKFTIP